MRPSSDTHDKYVIPHNRVAEKDLREILRGNDRHAPDDLQAIIHEGRLKKFKAWLRQDHIDPGNTPWNPKTIVVPKRDFFAPNDTVYGDKALEAQKRELVEQLYMLKHEFLGGEAPINFFDIIDDYPGLTNPMIRRTLQDLLEDDYKELVYDEPDLHANFQEADWMTDSINKYRERALELTINPKINLWVGSMSSVDDARGELFQKEILNGIMEGGGYIFGICWGQQAALRTHAGMNDMDGYVLTGALKTGYFPVDLLNDGPFKHMFNTRDGVQRVMTTSLHTDHVVLFDQLNSLGDRAQTNRDGALVPRNNQLQVIARDPIMNRPYGFMTGDKRVVALAFHAEHTIPSPNERTDISAALQDPAQIQEYFQRRAHTILEQYDVKNIGQLQGNLMLPDNVKTSPGKALYCSVLRFLTDELTQKLQQKRGQNEPK